jgi:hypothetical protein
VTEASTINTRTTAPTAAGLRSFSDFTARTCADAR